MLELTRIVFNNYVLSSSMVVFFCFLPSCLGRIRYLSCIILIYIGSYVHITIMCFLESIFHCQRLILVIKKTQKQNN